MAQALVLVDVQNDYFPGGRAEVPGSVACAARAADLLAAFRARGLPVVHVRHLSARPGATFLLPGTPGAEIHPSVAPAPGEPVVEKAFPNAFRETGLLALLRERGADRLVVCGMMTQMCVDATVRAAFDLGLRCDVAADACAARPASFGGRTVAAEDVHAAFLGALGAVYARVAPAADLVAALP
jgi:nicotinamidase-related amidase